MSNNGSDQDWIDEQNARALAANLTDWRAESERRFAALENEVATMRTLVAAQNQVIGDALQRVMGSGATVVEGG
jgi:hypothetical protein